MRRFYQQAFTDHLFTLSFIRIKPIFRLFIALLFVGSFTACKKDNDDNKPKTKTELLTAKNWRLSAAVGSLTSGSSTYSQDIFADMEPCQKDDFEKFSTDKTAILDQGATKCDDMASDPQTQKVAWNFESDETKLKISEIGGGDSYTVDLVELTATTMIQKYTEKEVDPDTGQETTLTYTLTYAAF
ncbi:hypothetical protein [Hymenobacter sp. DG25A]|uniref:hypothetical protein n=1 Tax=Hymenobacter sp. DG25A TaxID=1385663 RepID=UPI0012FB56EB|nr:hypothetical protein [Hymenobacter sp. DG25A]